MVDSGIRTHQECQLLAQKLETRALDGMICEIQPNEDKKDHVICVKHWDKSAHDDKTDEKRWEEFAKECMEKDICYGISYINWKSKEGRDCNKLVFVFWNGDDAKTKMKMKYSSTKNCLKNAVKSISLIIQACDEEEFSYKSIVDNVSKGDHNLGR